MGQEQHLLKRAKRLRIESTPFEVKLWRHLSGSKLQGHKFRRQHVIDRCIVDFFCPQKGLIVEVDGDTHDLERDRKRDEIHARQGLAAIRITNADVGRNIEGVWSALLEKLNSLPDRWPHPLIPSPEGEGS
ncbi:MAG TPA: DUF559 domain-containing protein [Sphingomicrobium sp.]|nr:DUF559 domain-containing protein [Sphingomicrobium sp.]